MSGKTAIIIVAAGNSSRLGSPKQLLDIQGKRLLVHVVDQALDSKADQVFVILGASYESLESLLSSKDIIIALNKDWENGMGSSIKHGIRKLKETGSFESLIISVCDQPYLTSEIFDQLLRQKNDLEIVTSTYADKNYGPPTLFKSSQFDNLMKIEDSEGARSLIKNYSGTVGLVPFDNGNIDMDTREDYQAYLNALK